MKNTDFESLKDNLQEDIRNASNKDIETIYTALKEVLKEFDRDTILKQILDTFNILFKTKRDKCIKIIGDIVDSRNNLTIEEKEKLRRKFLDLSNIHRTVLENIQSLLRAL